MRCRYFASPSAHPRLDALHQWLMGQGLSADVRVETTDIADAMLSRATKNTDLIAMGAYGTNDGAGNTLRETRRRQEEKSRKCL